MRDAVEVKKSSAMLRALKMEKVAKEIKRAVVRTDTSPSAIFLSPPMSNKDIKPETTDAK
jgi:hypothetical protein